MKSTLLALLFCAICSAFHVSAPSRPSRSVGFARQPHPVATVVKEDYRVAASFAAAGLAIIAAPYVVGAPLLIIGLFLVFQTYRIRFVFDGEAIEVKSKPLDNLFGADDLGSTGENFAVGGENRWPLSSVVNWEFFPSEDLPVLVYFKETTTPADKWDVGPGKWANSDEAISKGAVKGQVHFFPCIADAQTLKEEFVKGGAGKL